MPDYIMCYCFICYITSVKFLILLLKDQLLLTIFILLTYLCSCGCFLEKLLCKLILIYFTYMNIMKIIHVAKEMVKSFILSRKIIVPTFSIIL